MMINVLNPMILLKGHGIYTYHPNGPAMLRNPTQQQFRPPTEMDIPAYAHDGHGKHDEGNLLQGRMVNKFTKQKGVNLDMVLMLS